MGTQVKSGSAGANKLQNVALFTAATQQPTWHNLLTGAAPAEIKSKPGQKQTEPGAPIVRVTNLEKTAGDEVTMDIFHNLTGLPTMGDRKLEGRGESMSQAHFDLKIDQGRHLVDAGGRMSQKRTKHNLRATSRKLMQGWYGRLQDERTQVHLFGARGDFVNENTILPLADHPEFEEYMVNPVTPPTYNRHMYGGDATAVDNLDAADLMTLSVVDNLRLFLDESGSPIQPMQFEADEQRMHDPLWGFYISPRQWFDLQASTSMKDWQKMTADAVKRSQGFNHPLFKGECAMWNGILIKKMNRTTRFSTGSTVDVCTNSKNATVTQVAPGVAVERAVLLGAQALGHAWGRAGKKEVGAHHFHMHEEPADHGNSTETVIAWMDGMGKVRFKNKDGYLTDHGVIAVDTAVSGL